MSLAVQTMPFPMLLMEAAFEQREAERALESTSDLVDPQGMSRKMPQGILRAAQKQYAFTKEGVHTPPSLKKAHTYFLAKAKILKQIHTDLKTGIAKMPKRIHTTLKKTTVHLNNSQAKNLFLKSRPEPQGKTLNLSPTSTRTPSFVPKTTSSLQTKSNQIFQSGAGKSDLSSTSFTEERTREAKIKSLLGSFRAHEKEQQSRQNQAPLQAHKWKHEETLNWRKTQSRHHEDRHGQHQQNEEQKEHQKETHKKGVGGVSRVNTALNATMGKSQGAPVVSHKKPQLTSPKLGIYALYYILTKIGILSESSSTFTYKNEITELDRETTETHQKRLREIKKAIDKEKC